MSRQISHVIRLILVIVLIVSMNSFTFLRHSEALTQKQIDAKVNAMTDGKKLDATKIIVKYKEGKNPGTANVMVKDGKKYEMPLSTINVPKSKIASTQDVGETKNSSRVAKEDDIENIKELLRSALANPNIELATPNYIGYTESWTDNGSQSYPSDYTSNHWYYSQGNLREMWDNQGCPGGANCGGDNNVVVAVIDTGLAFHDYDDTGEDGFVDYLWDNDYYYYNADNNLVWLGVNGGKDFSAVATDYNPATGFNIFTNSAETPNNGKDDDCNGLIDDYNGIDAFAWRLRANVTMDTCDSSYNPIDYSASSNKWMWKEGHAVDTLGHGSFVTGLISGSVDNTASVSPAFNVSILPIAANVTFENAFYSWDVENAMYYATYMGADVINMSLGGFPYDEIMEDMVNWVNSYDVLMVAASGNGGRDGIGDAVVDYPAAYDNVIAVGAVNANNAKSSYSNYGSNLDLVAYVGQVSGAGTATYQETLSCAFGCSSASTYTSPANTYGIGTSFAAPQVAAAAAIIKSNNPTATVEEIQLGLMKSATDITSYGTGWDLSTGFGVLDFQKANNFNIANIQSSFFPFYATNNATPQSNTWIIVGNPSTTEDINSIVDISGVGNQNQRIAPGAKGIFYFPNTVNGPATVFSDGDVYVTQRELFGDSFNEYESIDSTSLSTKFYFPFYATNGTTSNTWIIIGNPADATNSANITVKVAGVVKGTDTINPGEKSVQYYPNTIDGPVEVSSDQPIYVTQRELFGNSFNEYKGLDASSLSTNYYFPFYATKSTNNPSNNTWIIVGNPSDAAGAANITVEVGGVIKGTDTIQPGEKSVQYYPDLIDGPVKITSTREVYVTQRELFGSSFNEYEGIDANSLANHYYFPFYATSTSSNPANNTWVIIGNPGLVDAHVTVKVGGVVKSTPTILPGEKSSQYFPNLIDGPVEIISDVNVYVTQRELFGNSFNEYKGIK